MASNLTEKLGANVTVNNGDVTFDKPFESSIAAERLGRSFANENFLNVSYEITKVDDGYELSLKSAERKLEKTELDPEQTVSRAYELDAYLSQDPVNLAKLEAFREAGIVLIPVKDKDDTYISIDTVSSRDFNEYNLDRLDTKLGFWRGTSAEMVEAEYDGNRGKIQITGLQDVELGVVKDIANQIRSINDNPLNGRSTPIVYQPKIRTPAEMSWEVEGTELVSAVPEKPAVAAEVATSGAAASEKPAAAAEVATSGAANQADGGIFTNLLGTLGSRVENAVSSVQAAITEITTSDKAVPETTVPKTLTNAYVKGDTLVNAMAEAFKSGNVQAMSDAREAALAHFTGDDGKLTAKEMKTFMDAYANAVNPEADDNMKRLIIQEARASWNAAEARANISLASGQVDPQASVAFAVNNRGLIDTNHDGKLDKDVLQAIKDNPQLIERIENALKDFKTPLGTMVAANDTVPVSPSATATSQHNEQVVTR